MQTTDETTSQTDGKELNLAANVLTDAGTPEQTNVVPETPVPDSAVEQAQTPVVEAATEIKAAVTEATTVVQNQTEEVALSAFEETLATIERAPTVYEAALLRSLKTYVNDMAPGKIMEGEAGSQRQYGLWTSLRSIIQSSPDEEFKRLWSIVLMFANEYRNGAFGERYVFRFSEFWLYDVEELATFQRILTVINLTAEPSTRQASIKKLDITRTFANGLSEQGRSRLLAFYQ